MSPAPTPQTPPVDQDAEPAGATGSAATAEPHAGGRAHAAWHSVGAHTRFWATVGLGLTLDLWSKHWAFHTLRQDGRRVLIPRVLEFHTTLNPGALFGIGRGRTALFVIASLFAVGLVLWMFAQCPRRRWLIQIALGAILAGALGNVYDRVFVRLVPYGVQTPSGVVPRYHVVTEDGPGGDTISLREYPPDDESRVRELPPALAQQLDKPVGYVRDFIKISQKWIPQKWIPSWIPFRCVGERELWPWVFNVADMLLVGGVGVLAVRLLLDRRAAEAPSEKRPETARN